MSIRLEELRITPELFLSAETRGTVGAAHLLPNPPRLDSEQINNPCPTGLANNEFN
jgi:hypothetical protein